MLLDPTPPSRYWIHLELVGHEKPGNCDNTLGAAEAAQNIPLSGLSDDDTCHHGISTMMKKLMNPTL